MTIYRVYWHDTHRDYPTQEEALAVIRASQPYLVVIHGSR